MRDQFDISGVFETTEFEIVQVTYICFYGIAIQAISLFFLNMKFQNCYHPVALYIPFRVGT